MHFKFDYILEEPRVRQLLQQWCLEFRQFQGLQTIQSSSLCQKA